MSLTPEQQAHLNEMQVAFIKLSTEKYKRGQAQHGGQMWKKPGMLHEAKQEVIDLWHYLCTVERQLKEVKDKYLPVDNSLAENSESASLKSDDN